MEGVVHRRGAFAAIDTDKYAFAWVDRLKVNRTFPKERRSRAKSGEPLTCVRNGSQPRILFALKVSVAGRKEQITSTLETGSQREHNQLFARFSRLYQTFSFFLKVPIIFSNGNFISRAQITEAAALANFYTKLLVNKSKSIFFPSRIFLEAKFILFLSK